MRDKTKKKKRDRRKEKRRKELENPRTKEELLKEMEEAEEGLSFQFL